MALAAPLGRAAGQAPPVARGVVVSAIGQAPIEGARVAARRAGTAVTTDPLGRFQLALGSLPDTLAIAAIGWRPDTVVVTGVSARLVVGLARAAAVVSDLMVTAASPLSLDPSAITRWQMPPAAVRAVPPAVEPDVFRSLALIPGVSFTSPFSARPMLRGYDAQDVATRIDGFELPNLYHLGRVFSSFPADAAERVAVAAGPGPAGEGGSTAGAIEVSGRSGWTDGFHAGGGLSLGSIGAFAGGGGPGLRYFGAARALHLAAVDLIPGASFPYHFEDLYGSLVFGPVARPRARITLFASRDQVGDSEDESLGWSNLLAGGRWRPIDAPRVTLEITGSATRFAERGQAVPSLHGAPADFRNGFSKVTGTAELAVLAGRSRLGAGLAVGWRWVTNLVAAADRPSAGAVPTASTRLDRPEAALWLDGARLLGRVTMRAGLRAELADRHAWLEPRLHLQWPVASRSVLTAALGRTARAYHLLSDARSEPDLDFFELWVTPNDTIPRARVDHATLDFQTELRPVVVRLSAYLSRGRGIGEIRPESDQRFRSLEFVRFGETRTRGLEAQLSLRGGPDHPQALSLSYAYSRSERSWGQGRVRWAQDRRHQLRLFGQTRLGRLRLFGALDAATGMPLTPFAAQVRPELPGGTIPGAEPDPGRLLIYGPENSAATSGTFRVDAGATLGFGGPDQSRWLVGVSVVNLLFGAVAPIGDRGEGTVATDRAGRPTPYRRLVDLPPIPTLTLRATF